MNWEDDKYDFPETLNQQERMIVLPIDKFIVTVPLFMTEVLCNMSMILSIFAGLLRWLVIY